MSNCTYLTGFPNGILMLATAPAAEDGAAAPAADAPADGKHEPLHTPTLIIRYKILQTVFLVEISTSHHDFPNL